MCAFSTQLAVPGHLTNYSRLSPVSELGVIEVQRAEVGEPETDSLDRRAGLLRAKPVTGQVKEGFNVTCPELLDGNLPRPASLKLQRSL